MRETLAPTATISARGDGTAATAGSAWRDSVDLAVEIGILQRDDGTLRFQEALLLELGSDDLARFQRALRRVVLAREHNDGLWDQTPEKAWPSDGAREFSRIAVWLLDSPPGDVRSEDAYEVSRRAIEGPAKLVENDEQWRVFVRWGEALGLISTLAGIHLPDPTAAVADELPAVFQIDSTLPGLVVRDHLGALVPVIGGGVYTRGLDAFLADRPRRLPNAAGHALTFALKRLANRQVIAFERRSDADQLILDDPQSATNPTHIVWNGVGE